MKWFYLVGILLLGVMWCKANEEDLQDITKNSSTDDEEDFFLQVKEELGKKCKKVGGEEAVNKLTSVLENVKVCLSNYLPQNTEELKKLKESSEGSSSEEQICTDKRVKVQECFKQLIEVWKECSEPDEKYLPEFLFDALEGVLDYVCADQDAFVIKVINSLDCIFTLAEHDNITDVCDDKFQTLADGSADLSTSVISKDLVCKAMEVGSSCYADYVEQQCGDSDLKDLITGLYTAANKACVTKHKRSIPARFRLY